MKILEKILDNYYKKQFIKYVIDEVNIRYMLDSNIVEDKDGQVKIQFKPKHYINYTTVLNFHKGDSLNWLISLRNSASNVILHSIEEIDKKQQWVK